MSYSVVKNKSKPTFDIIEKETDLTMKLNLDEKEARKVCRKLNLGGGFNGFTPTFFTEDFKKQFGRIK